MGCGSSKSPGVVEKSHPVYSHQSVPSTNGKTIMSPANKVNNYDHIDQSFQDLNGNLPPPRPPEQTREELLAGKMELMNQMDKYAKEVSFDAAKSENLETFTQTKLIPPRQEQHTTTTVTITEDKDEPIITESERQTTPVDAVIPRQQPPPQPLEVSPLNQEEVKDATALIIKRHKEQNEEEQRKQAAARIRQNAYLQEKLMQRREAKKKRDLAATASLARDEATRVEGGVALDSAIQTGTVSAEEVSTLVASNDESVKLSGIRIGSDIEAAEDKYNQVMAEAAPMPTAPETRKEVIYGNEKNIELFKDLEDFAVNMEQISDPSVTFGILMDSLLINQLSDLEKVRILFHWITSQNLNNIAFPSNIDEDTPMGFLFAIKQERKAYAELFCRLCSAAGLHAKVIRGFLKGVGYLPDHKFVGQNDPFSGSWNAVLIDQQWRLIDTHWGARHVVEMDGGVNAEDWATKYKYEEHYFLTNPDQLITSHFPFEKDWQLLAKPVTLEEYQDMPKVWPLLYKVKLELHSHRSGVITADQDGVVEIRLKLSEFTRRDANLKCELVTKQRARKIENFELACYTFQYAEGDYQVFRAYIPQTGEYLLKIFAMSKKYSDNGIFTNVCLYQINCPKLTTTKFSPKNLKDIKVSEIYAPFPVVNMPWGPPANPDLIRVIPVSHSSPVISCDEEGEATVLMETIGENDSLFFLAQLASVGSGAINNAWSNRVVHFKTVTTEGRRLVVFRMRTPATGTYSLTLYQRSSDGQQQESEFTGFCNYLVVSHAQSKPAPPYPPVPNGTLGPVEYYCQQLGISPVVSGKLTQKLAGVSYDSASAWIEPDKNGEAFVSFDNLQPMNVLVDMQGTDPTADVPNRVIIQNLHKKTIIAVRPPERTENGKEYVVKIYASPLIVTSGIPTVFHCIVSASKKMATQFPAVKNVGRTNHVEALDFSRSKYSNSEPMFSHDFGMENTNPSPCRIYKGGDDFILTFAKKDVVNFVINLVEMETSSQEENQALISGNSLSVVTLRIRIPKPGNYLTTVFAAHLGEQSLLPVHSVWIKATSASVCNEKYPQAFSGIWPTNFVELFYPLSKNLKRNSVNKIKIALAMLSKNDSGLICLPFPNVMMLTDQSTPVYPNKHDKVTHIFEWEYLPGPGEQNLSLVAQASSESQSLSYVLKFDVID